MAGVKLGTGARVVHFSVIDSDAAAVVTVSGSTQTIAGTDPGRVKVCDFSEFPPKGRATSGVRCHAFLKGEDVVQAAWVGTSPIAVGPDGAARILPAGGARRDGSGTPLDVVIGSIGSPIA